jgi:hypothetical protein
MTSGMPNSSTLRTMASRRPPDILPVLRGRPRFGGAFFWVELMDEVVELTNGKQAIAVVRKPAGESGPERGTSCGRSEITSRASPLDQKEGPR